MLCSCSQVHYLQLWFPINTNEPLGRCKKLQIVGSVRDRVDGSVGTLSSHDAVCSSQLPEMLTENAVLSKMPESDSL